MITKRRAGLFRLIGPCLIAAFALPMVALQSFALDSTAGRRAGPMYEITLENATVTGDGVREGKSKLYALRTEGGGQTPEVIWDPQARSKVLVFRASPTPAGMIRDRSEISVYSGVDFDKTWAVAMKVFIPEHVQFTDNWHSLAQCPQGGAIRPPFNLALLAPDQLAVIARTDENPYRNLFSTTMPKGRWVRLELEFVMGDSGHVKLWIDNKLLFDQAAVLRSKVGDKRCNFKVGTYRGKAATSHEVRLDDIRFGTSREAVLGR